MHGCFENTHCTRLIAGLFCAPEGDTASEKEQLDRAEYTPFDSLHFYFCNMMRWFAVMLVVIVHASRIVGLIYSYYLVD